MRNTGLTTLVNNFVDAMQRDDMVGALELMYDRGKGMCSPAESHIRSWFSLSDSFKLEPISSFIDQQLSYNRMSLSCRSLSNSEGIHSMEILLVAKEANDGWRIFLINAPL